MNNCELPNLIQTHQHLALTSLILLEANKSGGGRGGGGRTLSSPARLPGKPKLIDINAAAIMCPAATWWQVSISPGY